ncbi:sulfite:cytochrome C oxidoreductase subunit B [Achromobacter sp. UMC46]|uniref:SorB family sulfite dehydrogenase c-type cytochrome subunit n=1 Tax=Achromobacter sp. UMC46 TaxID=1862319 RepID=UPI001602324F|nr:sulfite:cytochrome C oxidoreductase subunit B [Achromobacter sp. UMC46]MBB1596286.1 sulfite:cytochrome C oxidoreductase subunit B [Achromobacter sp. UMC46]
MTRPTRRHPRACLVRLAVALVTVSACASAAALDIQLPPETATLHPGTGTQSAAMCLMCHSVDYLSSQPPMPLGFWDAEVKKMVGTYGAPIPAEQVPLIVQYLNQAYPPPQPVASPKP